MASSSSFPSLSDKANNDSWNGFDWSHGIPSSLDQSSLKLLAHVISTWEWIPSEEKGLRALRRTPPWQRVEPFRTGAAKSLGGGDKEIWRCIRVATGKSMRQIDFYKTNCCLRIKEAKIKEREAREVTEHKQKEKARGAWKWIKWNINFKKKTQSTKKKWSHRLFLCLLRRCGASVSWCSAGYRCPSAEEQTQLDADWEAAASQASDETMALRAALGGATIPSFGDETPRTSSVYLRRTVVRTTACACDKVK